MNPLHHAFSARSFESPAIGRGGARSSRRLPAAPPPGFVRLASLVVGVLAELSAALSQPRRGRPGGLAPVLTAAALFLAPLLVTEAQAQTVEFGAATYTATEDGTGAVVVVELDPAQSADVTIPLTRTNANGTADSDYSGVPASVTFAANETSKTFTVMPASDTRDEPNKSVTLGFGTPLTGVTAGTQSTTTVSLVDDDATPSLSVDDVSATEGSALGFTVTLSAASEYTVTVSYATSLETSDTAEAGDFTAVTATTLIFPPGDTTKSVSISTTGDSTDEDDETFTVTLSSQSSTATISDGTGTGIIDDDDDPPTVSVDNANAEEGDGIVFKATLSAPSEKTVTVSYATSLETSDTAEAGDLSGTTSGTLSFSPGDTTKTFSIGTTGDSTDEDNETFTVTLSSPSNATINDGVGTGTINDDDAPPTVSVDDANAEEGNGIVFKATLSAPSEKTVMVNYATSRSSGTTAEAGDFTAVTTTTLTFSPGDTSETFTVSTTEDSTDEDDETFRVTLTLPANANVTLDDAVGEGTINNDDDPPTVSVEDANAEEGNGIAFTATLSAASEKQVTVTYTASVASVATGSTAKTSDLSGTLTGSLTFAARTATTTITTRTFTINTDEDNIDERSETFTVTLSSPTNATINNGTGTGTINDDDATPTVKLWLSRTSTPEDDTTAVTVTATLDYPSTDPTAVTVSFAAVSPAVTADFTPSMSLVLAIAAEAMTSTGTVNLTPVDNETHAPNKDVTVSATASNGLAINAPADLKLEITNDDPPPVVTLMLTPPTIHESTTAGTHVTTVTATQNRPSSQATTVTVSAAAVDPAVEGDFTLTTNRSLTIAAGSKASTGEVTITAVDNETDAPHKVVTVSATAANTQGIDGDPSDETLFVEDDELAPTVTLMLAQSSIRESDDLEAEGDQHLTTVTVEQSHPSSQATTITLAPSPGDFTLSDSGSLTIPAGETEISASVTLTAVDNDTDAPHKELTLNATASNTQGVVQPDGVPLTIVDEELAPTVTLFLSSQSIGENGGEATVRAEQSHPSSEQTSITVAAAAVSPAVDTDFALAGTVLAIPAGQTETTGSATLTSVDNDTDAPDKEVTVSATADNTQGIAEDPESLTLTIENDELAPTVDLRLSRNPIPEAGGETTVTAMQSHPSSEETTVTVSAASVSPAVAADFTRVGSTLRIAAGRKDSTGTVTLAAEENDIDAPNKNVTVSATTENTQGIEEDPDSLTLAITDDDERGFVWIPTALTIREAAIEQYSVALTSEPTADVTVTATGKDGVLEMFTENEPTLKVQQTLTFTTSNWSAPQRLNVLALADANSIRHTASGGDYAGHQEDYGVTVVKIFGTATSILLTVDRTEIAEGARTTPVTVTATLEGDQRDEATAVAVTVGADTAAASDFIASPATFTLTIPANSGSARETITLTPTGDGLDEDDETVSVSGTATGLDVSTATITIEDDDTRGVTVSRQGLTVDENESRSYTVVLDSQPSADVTVTPSVAGDSDVMVSPTVLTFTTTNWSQARTVTVSAADDVDPVDDSATVSHAVAGADYGANNVTASSVAITVDDDDGRGVRVSARELSIDEDDSATYTVVLNTAPTGNVRVTPSVTGDTDVTISPSVLTFSTTTWGQPQTVRVSVARDADPDDDRAAVSHAVAGADYGANHVTAPEVLVSVIDDDLAVGTATLRVSPDAVDENASRVRVTVAVELDGPARATDTTVSVLVRGRTASVTDFEAFPSAPTVIVPANRRFGKQLFDFSPTNDAIDEGEGETVTISAFARDLDIASVELTITDDDERGLRASRSAMTVNEDSTATYRLALTSAPTDPVTVTPTVTGASEVTVRPETLSFTDGNWNEEQTVTVSVARDPDADDGEAALTHAASGGDYDDVIGAEIEVTARDDGVESAGIRLSVSPDTLDENGGPQTVAVTAMLDAAARATATEVTVAVESGTAEEGTDFSDIPDFTLTIPANGTAGPGNVSALAPGRLHRRGRRRDADGERHRDGLAGTGGRDHDHGRRRDVLHDHPDGIAATGAGRRHRDGAGGDADRGAGRGGTHRGHRSEALGVRPHGEVARRLRGGERLHAHHCGERDQR